MSEWVKEYWIKALFASIISVCGIWGKKKINKLECKYKEQEAVRLGVQALLKNEIYKQYSEWMEKGYCPIHARENIQNMYERYHNLGENGVMTDLVKKIFELPTEKEKENE